MGTHSILQLPVEVGNDTVWTVTDTFLPRFPLTNSKHTITSAQSSPMLLEHLSVAVTVDDDGCTSTPVWTKSLTHTTETYWGAVATL